MGKPKNKAIKKRPVSRKKEAKKPSPRLNPGLRNNLIVVLILTIATYLLYGPSHQFEYTFDDDVYTAKNQVTSGGTENLSDIFGKGSVYGFSGENSGTYRPVTLLTFALEKNKRRPFNPERSHRVQVFLYLLTVISLFFLLKELLPKKPIIFAALIALLFLAHPIHTEVVANVKSRDEILALLFSILGLLGLLFSPVKNQWGWLLASGICFFLGNLSKETAITMMAIAPLTLWVFNRLSLKTIVIQSIPAWAAGLLYLIIRTAVLEPETAHVVVDPFINNSLLAAETVSQRIATNILLLGKYVNLLVFPHPLSYDYSFQQIPVVGFGNAQVWFSLVIYLALFAGGIYGIMKRSVWGYLVLFYLITISIVSHIFFPIAATLGERFLFMPSVAFCMAVGFGLWLLGERFGKQLSFNPAIAVLGLVFLIYGFKTYSHLPVWKSNDSLFAYGIEVAPNSFRTHLNLAEIQRAKAEAIPDQNIRKPLFDQAIDHYRKSLDIYPNNPTSWYNLGVCYFALNDMTNAISAYRETLNRDPNYFNAANNLGVIYFRAQDYENARQYFSQAVQANPNFGDGYANLGAVYHNQGNFQMAIAQYEKALEINPNHQSVLGNMVKIYEALGDGVRAAEYGGRLGR